jgi:hypothetical protein
MNTVSDIHENGNDTLTLCFKVPLILQPRIHRHLILYIVGLVSNKYATKRLT